MAEYMESAPASAVGEAVEMLAGPPLLHCVHSRAGAQVAVRVLAQGTAKQRKKVIKAMKGVLPKLLHVVIKVAPAQLLVSACRSTQEHSNVGMRVHLLTCAICPGHVKVMAMDEWAHVVLIAALAFTDDTALLSKTLVPEIVVRNLPPVQAPLPACHPPVVL